MYRFKIDGVQLNTIDGELPFQPKKVNVFIGPNNSGKSRFLKELRDYLSGDMSDLSIIKEMNFEYPEDFDVLNDSYNLGSKMVKDLYGNWVLRAFSNKTDNVWNVHASFDSLYTRNLHSFGGDWKEHFTNIVNSKEKNSFFQYFGPLFFQYLGTEERLTICKEQINHGLDSNNTNYLSSFKFESELLKKLSENVERIFKKCIVLDTQTLGDRLVFRVGNDLKYVNGLFANEQEDVTRLLNEKKLDNQGDGLKAYVSTFLSLNLKGSDILLIDEPEAFLHPPLARQIGELIGDFAEDKQIFISTHSVDVLKGILSKNQDVNIIRITQPETYKNKISVLDKEVLESIIHNPLLRVSRILEGLFCEKVVITEAEADELIYQELIEKTFTQSGLYFAHGQNKQTLADIAALYDKIGITYEIITDFDVLRVNDEFNEFLNIMKLDETEKQQYRKYIGELRTKIEGDVSTEGLDDEASKRVLKVQKDKAYHELGIEYLDDGELKNNITQLLNEMDSKHLHILRTGELETLLLPFNVEYTHNKGRWVVLAINKISELTKEEIESQKMIYDFLSCIVGKQSV